MSKEYELELLISNFSSYAITELESWARSRLGSQ